MATNDQGNTTKNGKLLLVKLWNENRKSTSNEVKQRAIEMLLGAFDSPEEMLLYFKKHKIDY
jgi:hypothetical protein